MVFCRAEQLSSTLQGKDTTIQEAKGAGAMLAESHLRRQRSDDAFDRFYESVVKEELDLTEEPVLPGKLKVHSKQLRKLNVIIMKAL